MVGMGGWGDGGMGGVWLSTLNICEFRKELSFGEKVGEVSTHLHQILRDCDRSQRWALCCLRDGLLLCLHSRAEEEGWVRCARVPSEMEGKAGEIRNTNTGDYPGPFSSCYRHVRLAMGGGRRGPAERLLGRGLGQGRGTPGGRRG